jgi:hypothetical protein
MGNVFAARVTYSGSGRPSRSLEERLMVRFPKVWIVLGLVLSRLDPRSRVRQTLLQRAVVSGWDAASRRDFKLMLVRYSPDVEVEFDPDFEALGLGGTYRGHDGLSELIKTFGEAWERWALVPAIIVDRGDRILVLGYIHLPGNTSGMELVPEMAQLITLRGALVGHEQHFLAWDKGLRAMGLDPDAIILPAPKVNQPAPPE